VKKFALFFTFKGETLAKMIEQPSDRIAAVRKIAEASGGTLEAYYWMTGPHDGFAIFESSDSTVPAAISLAISSTGVFSHTETYELFDAVAVTGLLAKAKLTAKVYQAPGT
jgi:uncharacterized protein with GYD domain